MQPETTTIETVSNDISGVTTTVNTEEETTPPSDNMEADGYATLPDTDVSMTTTIVSEVTDAVTTFIPETTAVDTTAPDVGYTNDGISEGATAPATATQDILVTAPRTTTSSVTIPSTEVPTTTTILPVTEEPYETTTVYDNPSTSGPGWESCEAIVQEKLDKAIQKVKGDHESAMLQALDMIKNALHEI